MADNVTKLAKQGLKLLQGYLWYPKTEKLDFGDYIGRRLEPNIHIIWDEIRPPFAFFDDGTLAASQHIFQFTVLMVFEGDFSEQEPQGMIAWIAEHLQAKLNTTPPWVGWQIFEDLRSLS